MSRRRTIRVSLLALLVPAALALAGVARASLIVYDCGPNLCQIAPDGSGQKQLTTDGKAGTAAKYGSPSLSHDGSTLAFVYDYHVVVAQGSKVGAPFESSALTVVLTPDGRRVAINETYGANGLGLCITLVDGSGRNCPYGNIEEVTWAPDGSLLTPFRRDATYPREICRISAATNSFTGFDCPDVRAVDQAHDLFDPAVSPDGKLLAVVAGPLDSNEAGGSIELYDYASGKLLRTLTNGTGDHHPVWSPDGTQLAFERGGSIYLTAVNGPPGSERRLVAGAEPTWGGSTAGNGGSTTTGGGSTAGALQVAYVGSGTVARGGLALRVTCPATCAAVAIGAVQVGSKVYRTKPVTRALPGGSAVQLVLPLPAPAIVAIRKALASGQKVIAQAGAKVRVGNKTSQKIVTFAVTG